MNSPQRNIGLFEATSVGVAAIVGGGILALAGIAFATTGPSAILAFALNGIIAFLTALSFAEMASSFPQSGGIYTFAKKVLNVEAAFAVGWVVCFASIVAAVLYALGFGFFAAVAVRDIWTAVMGQAPDWIAGRVLGASLAVLATLIYMAGLMLKRVGGGQWINVGKVAVFALLIATGLWAFTERSPASVGQNLSPFFSAGAIGLFQAMGFTFIALQGFDLIAAIGGEIRDPRRNIPRAMLYSLGIALAIYLPLLFIISTVGVGPGASVTATSRAHPEAIIAVAAENYLGRFGYWLVITAALLSMLSALQANLFAASRVAQSMARDRTLPGLLSEKSERHKTPVWAILSTGGMVVVILLVVPNIAVAGAAASLIFLITFALGHWISILIRTRRPFSAWTPGSFRVPLFPLAPVVGAVSCTALALYQGISVPSAGLITSFCLAIGGLLFLSLFKRRARILDASSEARDPEGARLRGRSPLVLVPIANPANAEAMVTLANALTPPAVGRVMLLSVVVAPEGWRVRDEPRRLRNIQSILGHALTKAIEEDVFPEALTTIAADPWMEIQRVARLHRCGSVLLGLTDLDGDSGGGQRNPKLDELMGAINSDVVVLRARQSLDLKQVKRILVLAGGRGGHNQLRARLLGSLSRIGERQVILLRILPTGISAVDQNHALRKLEQLSQDETGGHGEARLVLHDSTIDVIAEEAALHDLVILGSRRFSRYRKSLGDFVLKIAHETTCPLLIISRRG